MKELGLYTIDSAEVTKRVEEYGLKNIFANKL
jgi:hypothetical protein